MGLGIGDFDTDGYIEDIFKTHLQFRYPRAVQEAQREQVPFAMDDNPGRAALKALRRGSWVGALRFWISTTTAFPIYFFTTGMVYPEVEAADPAAPLQNAWSVVILRNLGGGKF